jgi:recombination associated protein RdgC
MWFKNLVVYRLGAQWSRRPEEFEAKLAQQPLQKCGGFEMESRGWVGPQRDGQYLYRQNRQWLLALGLEQKLLPGSVIRQAAEERIAQMEGMLGHPIGRKQKRDIKDKVTAELMPRALSRRRKIYAWIDTANGWLAVDAAGEPQAQQVLETLRRNEDRLPVTRLETEASPSASMSRWITAGEVQGPFGIDEDLELRAPDATKASVRYARHGLGGKDIRDHIAAGKQPVRLGLTWNDRISFVLTEELHVKRLSFLEILERESSDETENEDERFDIDFALMTGELSRMLADLVTALGGEKHADKRRLGLQSQPVETIPAIDHA